MKLKRKWKIIFAGLFAAIVLPLLILLLVRLAPEPPAGQVEYARLALEQAEKNNAGIYSRRQFNEARALYDSAMVCWQRENMKFIYLRDFGTTRKFAELSAKKAEQAMETSLASATNLKIKLKQKIDTLNTLSGQIDKHFSSYPLPGEARNRISKGKMLLKESEIAYTKGQYLQSNKKLIDAEYLLTTSFENATSNLKDYFRSYPQWKKWVDKTISESRQSHSYSIIVDKYARKCFVYLGGVRKYVYDVELGKNWVGDKKSKGDKATPEGMYKIVKKFDTRKTKYHKALLLDYPNDIDRDEFKRDIALGTLPASARIGGLIELHGNGGKGIDWTEGCIALTDSDMDMIFRIAKEGTPVTIVGSITNLRDIPD